MNIVSEIGYLEAFDTILDFIVSKVTNEISKEYILDDEDLDLIEVNRFERANIILSNFYEQREQFKDLNEETAKKVVSLVYSSISKPFIMNGITPSELDYFRENSIFEDKNESFLFNNYIFDWYKYDNTSELTEMVFNLIKSNQNNTIYSLNHIDINLYKSIIANPQLLGELNWRTFEKLLANILEKFEYEIELQRGTKDGGIDIIAFKKNTIFGPERYLIQAKRWKNKVGVEPVQRLIWAHNHYKVTKSCIATTSAFTRGAWELAENHKWQVELKDYDKIIDWINLAVNSTK